MNECYTLSNGASEVFALQLKKCRLSMRSATTAVMVVETKCVKLVDAKDEMTSSKEIEEDDEDDEDSDSIE